MSTQIKLPNQILSSQTFLSPEVRVVEASAGSGKTSALAKRYVQLLLNPKLPLEHIPIRNILAVTFTNKATLEMKSRILEILKRLAVRKLSQQQIEDILGPIGVDPKTASAKAYNIMEAIIRQYNFFQVNTIDEFINALLSGCAFKIGLTANFKIKTNYAEYLERSLDELIDQSAKDRGLTKLFANFIHHYLYLENRTGWFPKEDMLDIIQHLFSHYNRYGLPFKEGPGTAEDLIKKKRIILEQMQKLKEVLSEATDKRFLTSFEKFLTNNTKAFDIDSVPDYFSRPEVPVRKNTEVARSVDTLWEKINKNLRELCQEEAQSLFNPYIQIFQETMNAFYRLSSKDDILFLDELNKRAGRLFDEDYVTVEELYYRLATRFHHYLVDEFQDTSRLQWHNLEKMVEEAISTGGTLFYVGDRKQAIYAFRGGDVSLFEDIRQKFHSFNVNTEVLSNNWRSQRVIVEFNNQIFAMENLRRFIAQKEQHEEEKNSRRAVTFGEDDWQTIGAVYGNAQQTWQPESNQGLVHVEFIDIDRKEERNALIREKLIVQIKELKKRFAYRDIAILTRDNKDIEEMTNWLLAEGILVDSERTSNIKEHRLIQEIIAFLKFLDSPIDNVSFADFILGELFAKTTGIPSEEMHRFVFSLRSRLKAKKDFYLYTAFREKYFEVWEKFIEEFFKNVGLYPLYELMVSVYYRFDCLRHFPEAQGFLMHFLELIKENEEDHADIESFLNYFDKLEGEDLYVQITDTDAVKILTIHKAKGLEFPVVLLPFLGMEVQVAVSKDNIQSYILQKSDEAAVELVRFKEKYKKFSDELCEMYSREYKRMFLTELNSVYVALTRAKYEMYVFIPKKIGNAVNPLRFLIPEELYAVGQPHHYKEEARHEAPLLKLPCSRYHDWIAYLKDEFQELDEIKYRQERLKGEAIHFLLSFVKNLKEQKKADVRKEALAEAEMRFSTVKDFKPHVELMENVLSAKHLKEIFYLDKKDEVFTEKEIVTVQGETKRLDRLLVKEKEVWVVDYKPSRDPQGRYEEQIQEYLRLVKTIYPDRTVRGYVVYLEELTIEEVTMSQVTRHT